MVRSFGENFTAENAAYKVDSLKSFSSLDANDLCDLLTMLHENPFLYRDQIRKLTDHVMQNDVQNKIKADKNFQDRLLSEVEFGKEGFKGTSKDKEEIEDFIEDYRNVTMFVADDATVLKYNERAFDYIEEYKINQDPTFMLHLEDVIELLDKNMGAGKYTPQDINLLRASSQKIKDDIEEFRTAYKLDALDHLDKEKLQENYESAEAVENEEYTGTYAVKLREANTWLNSVEIVNDKNPTSFTKADFAKETDDLATEYAKQQCMMVSGFADMSLADRKMKFITEKAEFIRQHVKDQMLMQKMQEEGLKLDEIIKKNNAYETADGRPIDTTSFEKDIETYFSDNKNSTKKIKISKTAAIVGSFIAKNEVKAIAQHVEKKRGFSKSLFKMKDKVKHFCRKYNINKDMLKTAAKFAGMGVALAVATGPAMVGLSIYGGYNTIKSIRGIKAKYQDGKKKKKYKSFSDYFRKNKAEVLLTAASGVASLAGGLGGGLMVAGSLGIVSTGAGSLAGAAISSAAAVKIGAMGGVLGYSGLKLAQDKTISNRQKLAKILTMGTSMGVGMYLGGMVGSEFAPIIHGQIAEITSDISVETEVAKPAVNTNALDSNTSDLSNVVENKSGFFKEKWNSFKGLFSSEQDTSNVGEAKVEVVTDAQDQAEIIPLELGDPIKININGTEYNFNPIEKDGGIVFVDENGNTLETRITEGTGKSAMNEYFISNADGQHIHEVVNFYDEEGTLIKVTEQTRMNDGTYKEVIYENEEITHNDEKHNVLKEKSTEYKKLFNYEEYKESLKADGRSLYTGNEEVVDGPKVTQAESYLSDNVKSFFEDRNFKTYGEDAEKMYKIINDGHVQSLPDGMAAEEYVYKLRQLTYFAGDEDYGVYREEVKLMTQDILCDDIVLTEEQISKIHHAMKDIDSLSERGGLRGEYYGPEPTARTNAVGGRVTIENACDEIKINASYTKGGSENVVTPRTVDAPVVAPVATPEPTIDVKEPVSEVIEPANEPFRMTVEPEVVVPDSNVKTTGSDKVIITETNTYGVDEANLSKPHDDVLFEETGVKDVTELGKLIKGYEAALKANSEVELNNEMIASGKDARFVKTPSYVLVGNPDVIESDPKVSAAFVKALDSEQAFVDNKGYSLISTESDLYKQHQNVLEPLDVDKGYFEAVEDPRTKEFQIKEGFISDGKSEGLTSQIYGKNLGGIGSAQSELMNTKSFDMAAMIKDIQNNRIAS